MGICGKIISLIIAVSILSIEYIFAFIVAHKYLDDDSLECSNNFISLAEWLLYGSIVSICFILIDAVILVIFKYISECANCIASIAIWIINIPIILFNIVWIIGGIIILIIQFEECRKIEELFYTSIIDIVFRIVMIFLLMCCGLNLNKIK